METPWKVVGYEMTMSERGTRGCRLYVEQQLNPEIEGEGLATDRLWFNPENCKYTPQLGHQIIAITSDRNRNIAERIIVVG